MKNTKTWNDLVLRAHFEALNPKKAEPESSRQLLVDLAERLRDPEPISAEERAQLHQRIQHFLSPGFASPQPKPMRTAGKRLAKVKNEKTGT